MSITAIGNLSKETIITEMGKLVDIDGDELVYFAITSSILTKTNLISLVGGDYDINKIDSISKNNIDTKWVIKDKDKASASHNVTYKGDLYKPSEEERNLDILKSYDIVKSFSKKEFESHFIYVGEFELDTQINLLKTYKSPKNLTLSIPNSKEINDIKNLRKILKYSNIVIMEEEDIIKYNNNNNVFGAIRNIFPKNVTNYIIVLCKTSVIIASKSDTRIIPVFPIENIVDTTGYKYSFAGALLSYIELSGNKNCNKITEALSYANIVSSFGIEGLGLNGFLNINLNRILDRYEEYKSQVPIPEMKLLMSKFE